MSTQTQWTKKQANGSGCSSRGMNALWVINTETYDLQISRRADKNGYFRGYSAGVYTDDNTVIERFWTLKEAQTWALAQIAKMA